MVEGTSTVEDLVRRPDPAFWRGRRVFLTGHTGFKGAWAARMLAAMGAEVTGFALDPEPGPSAFAEINVARYISQDLRRNLGDPVALAAGLTGTEIVLHLAAQAIVSQGYRDPATTWTTNVTGTMNLLNALRGSDVAAAVIVTSDKVYRNTDAARPFVEADPLGGDDPYSASKAACEILVASHRASFADLPPLATARAGNVIGGGDFGLDRLIPDLVRATVASQVLTLRNPSSTRPFQHVLDVVSGYLILAEDLAKGSAPPAVNFGPAGAELSVSALLDHWQTATGRAILTEVTDAPPMAEKARLALNSDLARDRLRWKTIHTTAKAVTATALWYVAWQSGADMAKFSCQNILDYLQGTAP